MEYWHDTISEEDLARFKAQRGDPAYMAEWEILAILISLKIWGHRLKASRAQLIVQVDSKAAMGAALKLASPRPLVNTIAAEIALELENLRADALAPEHFRGILNVEADALSRLSEGKQIPTRLLKAINKKVPARDHHFFRAWPAEWAQAGCLNATG